MWINHVRIKNCLGYFTYRFKSWDTFTLLFYPIAPSSDTELIDVRRDTDSKYKVKSNIIKLISKIKTYLNDLWVEAGESLGLVSGLDWIGDKGRAPAGRKSKN